MKLTLASKILAGCMMLLLLGCWKDYENFSPYEIREEFEIQELFEELKAEATQYYEGHSGEEIKIITPKLNIITIEPNHLVYLDGSLCDCPVQIEIIEASTKGEILLYGHHTVTRSQTLESAGEIYIKIKSKSGSLLALEHGGSMKLQMQKQGPGGIDDQMELFYGSGSGAQFAWSLATGDTSGWNGVTGNEWEINDSLQQWGFGYECFPDSLTWINVDKFVDVPDDEKTEVCVQLPEEYTNKNTAVFMVFNDINGIIALQGDSENKQWCEPYGKVPVGYEVTFIAISKQGEETFHFGSSMTTISFNHLEEFTLEETSLEDIKTFIMNL